MSRCLCCLEELQNEGNYHPSCLQKLFGKMEIPHFDLDKKKMESLALQMLEKRLAVTGVQKKMSLGFSPKGGQSPRLTLMNVKASYILKPNAEEYPELPANEHLTMLLARLYGIETAEFGLVHIDHELAYLTKRFDRKGERKVHVEDMAQLTETLTEHKYRGSYEKIGKVIKNFSSVPGNDLYRYLELILFSFISGNADMHLKNFSLIRLSDGVQLAPAYDLVNTKLVIKDDAEELALSLQGKKNKLTRQDFENFAIDLGLTAKIFGNILKNFQKKEKKAFELIDQSFLSESLKNDYREILKKGLNRLLS